MVTLETKKNKIAVVTGAGVRVGKVMAQTLIEQSYKVILHANKSFDHLEQWTDKIDSKNILSLIKEDLSTYEGISSFADQVKKSAPYVDLLINNASLYEPLEFTNISFASYKKMMGINIDAPFFISQLLIPLIKSSNLKTIVMITDSMIQRPKKDFCHYTVSKGALDFLVKALAIELAPSVRVLGIAPGAIKWQDWHEQSYKEKTIIKIPIKKLGCPVEISKLIIFLAENTPYINGSIIDIDGGLKLSR